MNDKTVNDKILMLDGAMGTMLQRSGLKLREVPESLNLTNPDLIESIHKAYFAAGSDFVQTNTFGANPYKLRGSGFETEQVIEAAVRVARKAADSFSQKGVLLDIGPSGRAMAPVGDADFDEIYEAAARQVRAGAHLCDGIIIETFTDLLEAKATALAAIENSDKPVYLTMSFQEDGRTFFGTSVENMILTFGGLGLAALGVNCSLGPAQLAPIVRTLVDRSPLPVIVQPNAGLPVVENGVSHWNITPDEYAQWLAKFADWGVAIVGGCCGTDPDFIATANAKIGSRALRARKVAPLTGICSASRIEDFSGTVVIGERLNPTGKKRFKRALYERDFDYIVLEAQKQKEAGASVLDVNVGLPDIDEPSTLVSVVTELQGSLDLPLQLDSSNTAALESAARRYAGKPLLNSVSGKESSLSSVLPIAKKYGAAVLGLTLDDDGIPTSAEKRLEIAKKILDRATALGIPKEDIFIDCLTLTASAQQDAVFETIKAVRRVREDLGLKTVLGVSNVSFGLPRRPLVTRTMLTAALANGLSAAIVNPCEKNIAETVAAWLVLSGEDKDAAAYIEYCSANPEQVEVLPAAHDASAASDSSNPSNVDGNGDGLLGCVVRGLKKEAASAAGELLKSREPLKIIEEVLIPALDRVGRDYEAKKIYLPQLIKSADAAKSALDVLKTAMASQGENGAKPGSAGEKVVIATVYGDVHDIGKNIVKVIMQNYNFDIIDLGKDVPPEKIVSAVKESGARIVGLSALMTTTVSAMKDSIAALRRECPNVKIIVGGAVLTEDLAKFVGSDRYAHDAMATVRAAQEFSKVRPTL